MARLSPATMRITPKADTETLRVLLQRLAGFFSFEAVALFSILFHIESSGYLFLNQYAMATIRIAAAVHTKVAPIQITVGMTEIVLNTTLIPALC